MGRTSLRVPHVTEEFVCQLRGRYFHPCFKSEGMNSFVINPLCSAHPTFLLWRLSSVSERGSKTGPDRSSYHTLRQIAHGLFGEALPPFGIPHIFQSNPFPSNMFLLILINSVPFCSIQIHCPQVHLP